MQGALHREVTPGMALSVLITGLFNFFLPENTINESI
jgi:hypothetical protein